MRRIIGLMCDKCKIFLRPQAGDETLTCPQCGAIYHMNEEQKVDDSNKGAEYAMFHSDDPRKLSVWGGKQSSNRQPIPFPVSKG